MTKIIMAVSTIQFRSTAPNRYRTAPNRGATHRMENNRSATPASTPPPLPLHPLQHLQPLPQWRGGGVEGEGWRGGAEGGGAGGGGGGLGVPYRTEPSARNTAQCIPQHTAARQYRTVPILNSPDHLGDVQKGCPFSGSLCEHRSSRKSWGLWYFATFRFRHAQAYVLTPPDYMHHTYLTSRPPTSPPPYLSTCLLTYLHTHMCTFVYIA